MQTSLSVGKVFIGNWFNKGQAKLPPTCTLHACLFGPFSHTRQAFYYGCCLTRVFWVWLFFLALPVPLHPHALGRTGIEILGITLDMVWTTPRMCTKEFTCSIMLYRGVCCTNIGLWVNQAHPLYSGPVAFGTKPEKVKTSRP